MSGRLTTDRCRWSAATLAAISCLTGARALPVLKDLDVCV
jgi:hypothetical protein